jgi:hypothetical protein
MENQLKLGAVLLGGYFLGRTKKGGMAVRLASRMAMAGTDATPTELVRSNATKLIQSEQTQELIFQLRDQFMQVVREAIDARVQNLSENLNQRTEAITSGGGKAVQQASETAGKATNNFEVMDTSGGDTDEEDESQESDDELQERIDELQRERITTLRKMAKKMFDEDEADKIDQASKSDLAGWIAEEEAELSAEEDQANEADEEDEEDDEDRQSSRPSRSKAGAR